MSQVAVKRKDSKASLPRLQLTSDFSISRQALKAFLASRTGNSYPDLPQSCKHITRPLLRPKLRPPLQRKNSSGLFPHSFPRVQGCKSLIVDRNTALPGARLQTFKQKMAWQRSKGLDSSFSGSDATVEAHRTRHSICAQDYPSPWTEGDG